MVLPWMAILFELQKPGRKEKYSPGRHAGYPQNDRFGVAQVRWCRTTTRRIERPDLPPNLKSIAELRGFLLIIRGFVKSFSQ
jgi:hypothetical protein